MKKIQIKRYSFAAILLALLFSYSMLPGVCMAADAAVQTQEYDIEASDGKYEKDGLFDEEIQGDSGKLILKDVSYEVLSEEPVVKDTEVTLTKEKVMDDESYEAPDEITQNGISYSLDKTDVKKNVVTQAHTQSVTDENVYERAVSSSDVPQTKSVTVKNEVTGEDEELECTLSAVERRTSAESAYIPILFTDYDADYYYYGSGTVQHDDNAPALDDVYTQILTDAGYDPSLARITSISWDGEAYTGSDGVVYRNATGTVERDVYVAVYEGSIVTDEEVQYTYTSTYTGTKQEEDESGAVSYHVKATATYEEAETAPQIPVMLIVGIALAIAAIVIALILFILAKKRKEKENG